MDSDDTLSEEELVQAVDLNDLNSTHWYIPCFAFWQGLKAGRGPLAASDPFRQFHLLDADGASCPQGILLNLSMRHGKAVQNHVSPTQDGVISRTEFGNSAVQASGRMELRLWGIEPSFPAAGGPSDG